MPSDKAHLDIVNLRPGDFVDSIYLLEDFQIRPRRDGGSFLTMVLRDATGKITGIMWENFGTFRSGAIRESDYVRVTGEVLTHQNQLQIRVSKVEKVSDDAVNPEDFLPVTPYPIEELEKEFWRFVAEIQDTEVESLVRSMFGKPRFWSKFRRAPSAVTMHQAYLGGLLEHTVGVTRNALRIAENYPTANRDLVLAGALLHDIGKTIEFCYDKKIAYTDIGRLIGHIPMGYAMIEYEAARLRTLSPRKKVLIQHIVLSHHGYLEFGSPKQPLTVEALIVHHADQLDAQLSTCLESAQRSGANLKWEYHPMFERFMYTGSVDALDALELLREMGYAMGTPARVRRDAEEEGTVPDLLRGMLSDEETT